MCGRLQLQGCRGGRRLKWEFHHCLGCHIDLDGNTWSSEGKSGQEEKVQHVGYIPPGDHHHHNDDDDDGDGDGKVHQSKFMIRLYSIVYTKNLYYVKHICSEAHPWYIIAWKIM